MRCWSGVVDVCNEMDNSFGAPMGVLKLASPFQALRPGYNQGGHWRCDFVTLVFQEKSHETNFHLFSACAAVVWRSVNKNNCSQESIFLSERRSFMVILIPSFIVMSFHLNFTHCSTSCHMKGCVFFIEWFHWQCQESWSKRLATWFVQIRNELTKSYVSLKKSQLVTNKREKMDLSVGRNQYFFYFLVNVHLLCLYNELISLNKSRRSVIYGVQLMKIKNLGVKHWLHCVGKIR